MPKQNHLLENLPSERVQALVLSAVKQYSAEQVKQLFWLLFNGSSDDSEAVISSSTLDLVSYVLKTTNSSTSKERKVKDKLSVISTVIQQLFSWEECSKIIERLLLRSGQEDDPVAILLYFLPNITTQQAAELLRRVTNDWSVKFIIELLLEEMDPRRGWEILVQLLSLCSEERKKNAAHELYNIFSTLKKLPTDESDNE